MNSFEQLNRIEQTISTVLRQGGRASFQAGVAGNPAGGAMATEFSSGQVGGVSYWVPWDMHGFWNMNQDSDHDGIPDAIDYYSGPGAFPPGSHSPM